MISPQESLKFGNRSLQLPKLADGPYRELSSETSTRNYFARFHAALDCTRPIPTDPSILLDQQALPRARLFASYKVLLGFVWKQIMQPYIASNPATLGTTNPREDDPSPQTFQAKLAHLDYDSRVNLAKDWCFATVDKTIRGFEKLLSPYSLGDTAAGFEDVLNAPELTMTPGAQDNYLRNLTDLAGTFPMLLALAGTRLRDLPIKAFLIAERFLGDSLIAEHHSSNFDGPVIDDQQWTLPLLAGFKTGLNATGEMFKLLPQVLLRQYNVSPSHEVLLWLAYDSLRLLKTLASSNITALEILFVRDCQNMSSFLPEDSLQIGLRNGYLRVELSELGFERLMTNRPIRKQARFQCPGLDLLPKMHHWFYDVTKQFCLAGRSIEMPAG